MRLHPTSCKTRRNAGFTLLEMVIVLGIIAMILGGAIFAMRGIGDSAKLTQVKNDCATLRSILEMYKLNAGTYPTTQQGLKALVDKPSSAPIPRMWSRIADKVPLDPWGTEYLYRFPGKKNATDFEIISRGKDGLEGGGDDISSQDM
ncbi:MAG: type II secretion system major pseudopilin GspG [Verrucomicrobia bacterium]|nr:type II secretion system major pseudopilin GspG [Verrucomicrobiota bacterium]